MKKISKEDLWKFVWSTKHFTEN